MAQLSPKTMNRTIWSTQTTWPADVKTTTSPECQQGQFSLERVDSFKYLSVHISEGWSGSCLLTRGWWGWRGRYCFPLQTPEGSIGITSDTEEFLLVHHQGCPEGEHRRLVWCLVPNKTTVPYKEQLIWLNIHKTLQISTPEIMACFSCYDLEEYTRYTRRALETQEELLPAGHSDRTSPIRNPSIILIYFLLFLSAAMLVVTL